MNIKNNVSISQSLVKMGLTPDESKSYIFLLSNGTATAEHIASGINISPTVVYRLMKGLSVKGFIISIGTKRPIKFQAILPSVAIKAFAIKKQKELEKLSLNSIDQLNSQTPIKENNQIEVLTGQKQFFSKYVELAKDAKEEILIISIGEEVPDEIKLVNRDMLEKNVRIKFLVSKYDETNHSLLDSWKKMGISIKYLPDSGYHMVVIDGIKSILATSNPKETTERVAMVINNPRLSQAFKDYFFFTWKKAKEI